MKNLLYILVFVTLLLAVLAGCNADLRTTPVVITVDKADALALWEELMLRRAGLFRELDDPDTDPIRRDQIRDLLKAENDMIAWATNWLNVTGGQFKLEIASESNLDVQVAR